MILMSKARPWCKECHAPIYSYEDYCAYCLQIRADSINEVLDYLKRRV